MFCNIPEDITQSFYRGQVNVTYKDSIFLPSSSFRFTAELLKVLNESNFSAEVAPHIFMVTNGGPEHCVNFYSVKIPLLIIFRELRLQSLVALRTAPGHSYINMVERVMSIFNIGFQNVALERKEPPSDGVIKNCKNMEDLQKNQGIKQDWQDSVKSLIEMLEQRTLRLSLKDKQFKFSRNTSLTSCFSETCKNHTSLKLWAPFSALFNIATKLKCNFQA